MLSSSTTATFKALLSSLLLLQAAAAAPTPAFFSSNVASRNTTVARRAAAVDGPVSVGYFVNWNTQNFPVSSIQGDKVTHLLYAFAKPDGSSGAISLDTPSVDVGDANGSDLGGALGDLWKLKQDNRQMKVILSIGGWSYSQNGGFNFIDSADGRKKFISDAKDLIENLGLDGIDIDYEQLTAQQYDDYVTFMTEIRSALDDLAQTKGDDTPYLLTSAVGYAPTDGVDNKKLDAALDLWNIMDYDFAGSWSSTSDHDSNLFADGDTNGGVSVDSGVQKYLSAGVSASKLVMGIPFYGRPYQGTDGIHKKFKAVSDEDGGEVNYSDLPRDGAKITENTDKGWAYSYDSGKQELVSYDTPGVVKAKVNYIQKNNMAGTMYWELSMDKTGDDSLLKTAVDALGSLDKTKNHLNFPSSKYNNVKSVAGDLTPAGDGGDGGSSSTDTQTSTPSGSSEPASTGMPTGSSEPTSTDNSEPTPSSSCPAKVKKAKRNRSKKINA